MTTPNNDPEHDISLPPTWRDGLTYADAVSLSRHLHDLAHENASA